MKSMTAVAIFCSTLFAGSWGRAQTATQPAANRSETTLTVRSNLVLVPVLVKNKAGELVFSLSADDFALTDNGVMQPLRLEPDTDAQPLALAVIVQTGGQGAGHLRDYKNLGAILDAVIGAVPHRVAVVSFDSEAHLVQDFSPDTDAAAATISNLNEGDTGAAILDGLNFGIALLRKQPSNYRRAVVLFSETVDGGSRTTFEEALRAVDDTNTAIYSFGFSSGKAAAKHEASKLSGGAYSRKPYPPGSCMSRDADADPDAQGKRSVQALDCASDLLPPVRLARIAFLAAKDGLKRNVPEAVAQLTGGESFAFKDARSLRGHLAAIANDVPNRYVLSFRPQSPTPGLHALQVSLKDRPALKLRVRNAYWVDVEPSEVGR